MYPTSRNSKDYFEVEEVKLLPDEEVFQQEATKYGSRIFSSLKFIFLARTKSIHESEKEYVEKSWRFMRSSPLLLHLAVLSIYTTLFLLAYLQAASLPVPDALVYTPAEPAITYETKLISVKINETNNVYNSLPSPEVDAAWAALFHNANIRVTKEELKRAGRTSVELEDESGGFWEPWKYIREYIHQDYYVVQDTNVPIKDHVNHCIEMLRQIIMCKADTALMTYSWLPDFRAPWPEFGIHHQCVNWESIEEWGSKRRVDIFEKGLLVHPTIGPSYGYKDAIPSTA